MDGLAILAHKPSENPRKYFSHLEKLFHILEENYASYRVKPDRLAQQQGGGYSENALMTANNDAVSSYSQFLLTQVFRAAAPENVRRLLSHKDQTRLTVDDAYQVFFTEHRVEMDKKQSVIKTILEGPEPSIQEQDVASFRPQQKQQTRNYQQFNNRGNLS